MVYVIIEETRCRENVMGVTSLSTTRGVFKHKESAELAYMEYVRAYKKLNSLGDWMLYLEEIEEGKLNPIVIRLQWDGAWGGETKHGVYGEYEGIAV